MKREDPVFRSGDPENRRPSGGNRGAQRNRRAGYVGRASASGHSGYGSESVRPLLRDQLKLKELMVPPFPPPEEDKPSGSDTR